MTIDPPVGPDFNMDTIKSLAQANHAVAYVEKQPTDTSDSGMLINPDDSDTQFGVATYELPNGFIMTHSVASYMPASMKRAYENAVARGQQSGNSPTVYYNDLIDITLPYYVPHVLVTPRLNSGILQSMFATNAPIFPKNVAKRIKLEGDFCEFIDAYVPINEDISVFTYLAPDIMEIVLEKLTEFTIEFVDNHVYLYYRPQKATTVSPEFNTHLTMDAHKLILQVGLSLGTKLSNTTRPLKEATKGSSRLGKPRFGFYFWSFSVLILPIMVLLFSPTITIDTPSPNVLNSFFGLFNIVTRPIVALLLFFSIATYRYQSQKRRMDRYLARYGSPQP
jgi:hypothetical protein